MHIYFYNSCFLIPGFSPIDRYHEQTRKVNRVLKEIVARLEKEEQKARDAQALAATLYDEMGGRGEKESVCVSVCVCVCGCVRV